MIQTTTELQQSYEVRRTGQLAELRSSQLLICLLLVASSSLHFVNLLPPVFEFFTIIKRAKQPFSHAPQ